MKLAVISLVLTVASVSKVISLGVPVGPRSNVGEYGPANASPKPYAFNYQVTDDHGNSHFRREQGDHQGTVSGSYGYSLAGGLYRTVEYVADAAGFRARVKTNEPGVGAAAPADVHVEAEPGPIIVPVVPAQGVVVRPAYGGTKG